MTVLLPEICQVGGLVFCAAEASKSCLFLSDDFLGVKELFKSMVDDALYGKNKQKAMQLLAFYLFLLFLIFKIGDTLTSDELSLKISNSLDRAVLSGCYSISLVIPYGHGDFLFLCHFRILVELYYLSWDDAG